MFNLDSRSAVRVGVRWPPAFVPQTIAPRTIGWIRSAAWLSLAFGAALFINTGCVSYRDFTHDLRTTNKLTAPHLACLQYYVSEEIVFERDVTENKSQISGGKLRKEGERVFHVVTILQSAPGAARIDSVGENRIGVYFSRKQATPLYFRRMPRKKNRYYLEVSAPPPRQLRVTYDRKQYKLVTGEYARLRIEDDGKKEETEREDIFEGLRIDPSQDPRPGGAVIPRRIFDQISDACVNDRKKKKKTPRRP